MTAKTRYLTLGEMAERLDETTEQFKGDIERLRLPFLDLGPRSWRFDDLEIMLALGLASPWLPPVPPPREREFFTYLIWGKRSRFYKIGMAYDPEKRLKELSTGSCYELELLAAAPYRLLPEGDLHKRFRLYRTHREWFQFPSRSVPCEAFGEWTVGRYRVYIGGDHAS